MKPRAYDYVIIGGGTAGCVLANRLSAAPDVTVLLLEAGPSDRHWHIRMPMGNVEALKGTRFNWAFETEPEAQLGGRRLFCPRGRVLGGSSSINGMVHVRGHPRDFDDWARLGCAGWSYRELLPYFRRSECYGGRVTPYRGTEGPLHIAPGAGNGPLERAFLDAAVENGLPSNDDFNGACQDGAGVYDLTIHRGERVNGTRAYLDPVRERSNLTILTDTRATRILLERGRAVGVEVAHAGGRETLRGEREILLCAGAIHSPQLLMCSGIGDPDQLREQGIACHRDLPGVGAGLQNHIDIYMQYRCAQRVTLNGKLGPVGRVFAGAQWFLGKSGVCASNGFETGAFLTVLDGSDRPDTQIIFFPIAFDPGSFELRPWHGFQFHVGTQKPESRGWVRLASSDALAPPRILYNFLATDRDRRHIRAAMRRVREIAHGRAFESLRKAEEFPSPDVKTDRELDAWLVEHADTAYHPACTCRMGAADDPEAVVDSHCRVLGLEALRVVDASIMPELVNSNTNAAVVAMAEKAADQILGADPLPAAGSPTAGEARPAA